MNTKSPSLFDDFFFEDDRKEEQPAEKPKQKQENQKEYQAEALSIETTEEKEGKEENSIKKPKLELPEPGPTEQKVPGDTARTNNAQLIHRDYPFNPAEIEVVRIKERNITFEDLPERLEEQTEVTKAGTKETEDEETEDSVIKDRIIEEREAEETIMEEEETIPLPSWELDKNYYSIGEVAKLFEVNISHIRFWTNQFKLNPRTTRKGDRLYTPELIAELRLIHYLVKVKKHTIKGAKEKLKKQKITVDNNLRLKDSLTELRDLLLEIKNSI